MNGAATIGVARGERRNGGACLAGVCVLLLAVLAVAARADGAFTIAKAGRATASVALLPGSGNAAELAAADLASILKAMSGASFALTNDPTRSPCIVVGLASEWARLTRDEAPAKRLEAAAPESFILTSAPDRLLILGRDPAGASHGVYTLLHDLGCRWFFPTRDWEVIPRMPDIAVTANRVEGPALKVRVLSNGAGAGASARLFETWCRRNRLGSCYGPGAVHHSYAGYVPKDLFKEHPELFAWVSDDGVAQGTRQNGNQPCTTHPDVVKRVCDGVVAKLRREQAVAGEAPALVSVSPNDGTTDMCRCARCMATGTYGDCALLLANQVVEAIHGEFPRTKVGFLAYGRASAPPIKVRQAHSNVLVSVATSYNWKTSVPRLIEEWPKVARHVTVYEYYAIGSWGSQAPDNSMPTLAYMSQTLRDWQGQGIEGVNGEMENDWASCGHRLWAFARFAWDPALAPETAMADFITRCWGPAAVPMRRYYTRWEAGEKASPRVLRLAFRDLEEASRLAGSPDVARRVDQMSVYLYWHLLNREFKEARDEDVRNRIALEGDLLQYRWREAFMVQLPGAIFTVDRPARIGFSAAEVSALRTGALSRFLADGGEADVDVGARAWSADLVPLREYRDLAALAACEREQPFLESASYLFRAKAGETVEVVFEPEAGGGENRRNDMPATPGVDAAAVPAPGRDPLPMEDAEGESIGRFQVWSLGVKGTDLAFVLERKPAASNGEPLRLAFKAPRDALYRLNATVRKGGMLADFKGRPWGLAAEVKPRKNVLPLEKSSGRMPSGLARSGPASRYYFYVPRGTRHFLLDATVRGRSSAKAAVGPATGGGVTTVTVESSRECVVTVPAGTDGAVWKVELESERGRVALGGVPACVATHPGDLLVPRETGGEKRP